MKEALARNLFAFFLMLPSLASCSLGGGRNDQLPASTGQPYEVVLEGDTDSIVTKMLTEDVPALPQPEPLCQLIQVKSGKCRGSYLLVRTRIVVKITGKGTKRTDGFSIRLSHDENASPQTIIRITAASAEQLRAKLDGNQLRKVVNKIELEHLTNLLAHNPSKQNKKMQQEVKRMFGLDMKIPASMDASKKAKGFLWLSNNASSGMQNLIIFRLKGNGCTESNAWTYYNDEINKVLRRNILGETDYMYMRLGEESHLAEEPEEDLDLLPTASGLWDMKGDAMGGPYIMKVLPMSNGKIVTPRSYHCQPPRIDSRIVVIAFVYAPEMKKRNLTKQLEAVLTTINPG